MNIADNLVERARKILEAEPRHPNAQVIVLFTSFGNTHSCVINNVFSPDKSAEDGLLQSLVSRGETRIELAVCMWSNGSVDVPQFEFRRKLLSINAANSATGIVLYTGDGYTTKRLSVM